MVFEGGFVRPAPQLEPSPLRPPLPPSPLRQQPCRNRAFRNATSRRSGTVALQRVLRASHAAKSDVCDESDVVARQFAAAALRVALEVLDGRRSPLQLRPLAESGVIAALRTVADRGQVPGRGLGAATLTRVDVIMAGSRAAEVCAGYDRGTRHFALAARIVRGRSGWRLTAFRVF
ncbi:Rv3235 family protein [Nocardia sp. NBC_01388]|uniref:Rv3235 family protein n=1 Tax=Nocardia sp. NBC_01388 TaxID=2903596 RepID=UPI00325095EF